MMDLFKKEYNTITNIPSLWVGNASSFCSVSSPLVIFPNIAYWLKKKNTLNWFHTNWVDYLLYENIKYKDGRVHSTNLLKINNLLDHQDEVHHLEELKMMMKHCQDQSICNQEIINRIFYWFKYCQGKMSERSAI